MTEQGSQGVMEWGTPRSRPRIGPSGWTDPNLNRRGGAASQGWATIQAAMTFGVRFVIRPRFAGSDSRWTNLVDESA